MTKISYFTLPKHKVCKVYAFSLELVLYCGLIKASQIIDIDIKICSYHRLNEKQCKINKKNETLWLEMQKLDDRQFRGIQSTRCE
jgi:hypothetical protein